MIRCEYLFEEYIKNAKNNRLHKNIQENIIKSIDKMSNIIIYGPSGVGKYSYALTIIEDLSPSKLKYEKKLIVNFNKNSYLYKISDIHYEVDMSLLGCNSKMLWHEIYNQIYDSIICKNNKFGIIICKYFSQINSELLEVFYSYMQTKLLASVNIKFILITEDYSFIPDNIINRSKTIKLCRPCKSAIKKSFKYELKKNEKLNDIINLKNIEKNGFKLKNSTIDLEFNKYDKYKDILLDTIINIEKLNLLQFRETIYDLLIYNLSIDTILFMLINDLIYLKKLDENKICKLLVYLYDFFKFYNNNYRPIYHLEKILLYIVVLVNELQ
jgi:DNA polymerase III delta prime subunit